MNRGTYTSGEIQTVVELLSFERLESLYTKFETCRNEFNVRSFLQCVIHDSLIFIDSDGTGRVDYVTASSGIWVT